MLRMTYAHVRQRYNLKPGSVNTNPDQICTHYLCDPADDRQGELILFQGKLIQFQGKLLPFQGKLILFQGTLHPTPPKKFI